MALDISSPLPNVGGDLGTWGTKLNTAITEIINEAGKDSDIVSLQSTKADKTNPVLNGTATGTAVTTTGEADKLVKVNSSGRVILGGVDDGINKLQINGNAKLSGLAGTGTRIVATDPNGYLIGTTITRLTDGFDLNNLTWTINTGGWGLQNAPSTEFIFVENIVVATGIIKQKAYSSGVYSGSANTRWERECVSGVWSTWRSGLADSTLAGTGSRMVVADSSGNLSAEGIIYKPIIRESFNYTAVYGINYINSSAGGQKITLPIAMPGVEIEIISKTQGINTFLAMTGANKIYDIAGNDVTSTYTPAFALNNTKRIRFIGIQQDYWLLVEQVIA